MASSPIPSAAGIFKGAAWYYARYRRPYLAQIFDDVISHYDLDRHGRLLDLGCGTGELAVPLATHFESVIGIDPSADMLAEARGRAERAGVSRIRWIEGEAEDIDGDYGPVRLTTAGVSFHWMNKSLVLEKVYALAEKGGGMSIIHDSSPVRGKSKTEDWKMKRKELIIKYLGEERRAGDHLYKEFVPEKRPFEEIIAESPFKTFEFREYPYTTERTIDEIIGFLYSTSYASKRLFGDRAGEFEQELQQELLKLVPSGRFVEGGKSEIFFLRK